MTKYNKQYIVVRSQYVPLILQYIAIRFWHIVTALVTSALRYHPCYQSRSSMYIRGLNPWNLAESAKAVPIGVTL